jgi:DHA2 family methylenomycin A resistance protein-like MFS transporter
MAIRASERSTVATLAAAYLGLFAGLIDSNAVNLALPAIRADLGGGVSGVQWTTDAYNVTFAAVLLTAGSLGDRFGRRRMLRLGLIAFIGTSVACALAPSLGILLAARAAQGVAAAVMLPQGLAIASAAFPGAAGRSRATAAWAATAASSAALGPVIGGVLTDTAGWRFIFWLNGPVCLLALAMSLRYLPESRNPRPAGTDLRGQALAVMALGSLTFVLVEGRALGPVWAALLAVLVVTSCAAFVWSQRRVTDAMVPPEFFGNRQLTVALVATFAMTFGTYGMLFVNSLAFQQQRGASALATAIQFLPMPLAYLALVPVVNAIARRAGPRLPMTVGLLAMGAGMFLYAGVGPDADLPMLQTAFVLAGAGLAFNTGPAVGLALSVVTSDRAGLASGVVNLARLVGITVGIAAMGTVLAIVSGDSDSGAAFTEGARAAVLTGGIVETVGAVLVLRYARAARRAAAVPTKEDCHA